MRWITGKSVSQNSQIPISHYSANTVSFKSLELRTSKTAESISEERDITWKENLVPAHLCSALLIWHQIHPNQQRLFQGRAMLEQRPFPDKKAVSANPGHYRWFLNSYPRIQWLGGITEDQSRKKRNISFPHPHSHVIPQCTKSICPDCHKHGRRIRSLIFFLPEC